MKRRPIHPGEILGDELEEIGLSAKKQADIPEVPSNRLYQIIAGKRNISADTALRLGQYFGSSAVFWMNLQECIRIGSCAAAGWKGDSADSAAKDGGVS